MKITLYTITDCQFSKAEKEYLTSKNLPFEEKNLETNREYLTEMLNLSNNFAGTPVTKIEKDDGQTEVLKGFTTEEFDKALGLSAPTDTQTPAEPKPMTQEPTPTVVPETVPPVAEPMPSTPVVEPAPFPTPAVTPDTSNANTAYPSSAPTVTAPISMGVDPLSSNAPTLDMQSPMPSTPAPMSNEPPSFAPTQQPMANPQPAPVTTQPAPTPADVNTQNALNAVLNNLQEKSDDEAQPPTA